MGLQIRLDRTQPTTHEEHGRLDPSPFVPALVARWMTTRPDVTHRRTRGTLVRAQRPADPARVIEAAAAQRGDLLKFLGEDLLFFFTGREHEERASAVCDEIDSPTRAASGPVDLFLAGCAHRELFITGKTVEQLIGRAAPARHRTAAKRVAARIARQAADLALLRRCVPGIIRTNGVSSGKREIVVASVHLANLDDLIAEAGADVVGRHLADLTNRIDRSFAEHDVSFIASDIASGGPRIVCATGIVRPRANDTRRLVRTLRELLEYPSAIDLRIGIDRGTVDVRHEGTSTRRTMTLRGKAVANAYRFMSQAQRSEIATSARVIEQVPALRKAAKRTDDVYRVSEPPRLRRGIVNMLLNLGMLSFEHQDYVAAKHYWEEALHLSRRADAKRDEASLLHRLAETALEMRDPELAMVRCDEALKILRELDDARGVAAAYVTMGHARESDGDTASARACYRRAADILAMAPPAAAPSAG